MNGHIRVSSARIVHLPLTNRGRSMLARRLTIVSLMTVLFGMVFAMIVAEAGRDRRWQTNRVVPCAFDAGVKCGNAAL
jgi:hypothetical protein